MLKNVLEKDNRTLERHQNSSEKASLSLSHYDPNSAPMAPLQARPMSPRAVFSGQDRESLSPHVVSETRRDSPPSPFHRSDQKQQYHRYGPNGNFRGQSEYPPFPPLPHGQYMPSQPPPDRFFRENRTLAPQPDHQPRMHMDMIVGQSIRSPYEDRRAVPVPTSARRLPPDISARTVNYYSPPLISVSDDCDEMSERQQQQQQQPLAYNRHTYESLARENYVMREQLHEKDSIISSLQQRASQLEAQINELRQLPTGKISHIPIEYVRHALS